VKAQGDGFMIAFTSAHRAVACAIAIHRAIAAYDEHARVRVRVRIGIHTGEVTREGSDFFGRTVIVAARIAAAADGDGILVSSFVRKLTSNLDAVPFDRGRDVVLKGLRGTQRVHAVDWRAADPCCDVASLPAA